MPHPMIARLQLPTLRLFWLCLLLSLAQGLRTQAPAAPARADSITEPGRGLLRPLQDFLGLPTGASPTTARTLVLVLDPSEALAEAGFVAEFGKALRGAAAELRAAKVGLFVAGQGMVVKPTANLATVEKAVAVALTKPRDVPHNLMAAVREAAKDMGGSRGARHLLVVSLDNTETEDDVEGTGKQLAARGVTLSVVAPDACYADCHWAPGGAPRLMNVARQARAESPAILVGGDAPIIDLPHGFLFQMYDGCVVTPAGYAPWAWNRLVQVAGGRSRAYIFAGKSNWTHHCILFGECLDCGRYYHWDPTEPPMGRPGHPDHTEDYRIGRLQQMAPLLGSRIEAARILGRDPIVRATQVAWRAACAGGVMFGSPSLRLTRDGAVPENEAVDGPPRDSQLLGEEAVRHPDDHLAKARAIAAQAAAIEAELDRALAAASPGPGIRQLANARYLQIMLLLTRVALIDYEYFVVHKMPDVLVADGRRKGASLEVGEQSICHGLGIHLRRMAQDHPARPVMARLAGLLDQFERDFGGSPVSFALRRMSLPKFEIWYPGEPVEVDGDRPRFPGSEPRPPVTGRPTGSAPTGPTTGGGGR